MATRYAVASGNWNNTATWDGGTLPASTDDVELNGYLVNINSDIEIGTIKNTNPPTFAPTGINNGGSLLIKPNLGNGRVQKSGQLTATFEVKTGTIVVTLIAPNIVQGTGTLFLSEFSEGDYIRKNDGNKTFIGLIDTIVSDTYIILTSTTSPVSSTTFGKFANTLVGTTTEFTKQLLPNVRLSSAVGTIGNVFTITDDTNLTLTTNAFLGTPAVSLANYTNINFNAPAMIYTNGAIAGGSLVCDKGVSTSTTVSVFPLICPTASNLELAISADLSGSTTTVLSPVVSMYYGLTALNAINGLWTGGTYYINGSATANRAAAVYNPNSAAAQTIHFGGVLQGSGTNGNSGAIYGQTITLKGLYYKTVRVKSGGYDSSSYGVYLLAGSSINFEDSYSFIVEESDFGLAAAIYAVGNPVTLPLYTEIHSKNALPAISGTGLIIVKGGQVYNSSTAQAIDSTKVFYDEYVSLYYTNGLTTTGPFKIFGTTDSTAAQVWAYFQSNPDALSYITRLHNAATVDTTGDQISLIP
jgi:hypothetical protein